MPVIGLSEVFGEYAYVDFDGDQMLLVAHEVELPSAKALNGEEILGRRRIRGVHEFVNSLLLLTKLISLSQCRFFEAGIGILV